MSVIDELIREESNGTISFGNYELTVKSKVNDFEHNGDLYKVKTFKEITKLERNGMFVYESVPGTAVENLDISEKEVRFSVEGPEDAQITLELEAEKEYKIYIDDTNVGKMKTNLGGKLMFSVELGENHKSAIRVVKLQ
ncbi:endosialidase [Anaerocolumna sp. MB42-C2]|uniref:endosialidase n=1 Tax=Anaerocolumna sp. MB42-C2 TaxID=3070997 RepID=UPI0027E18A94|nr:endosialidase [Anaerocolumna sp. MB42-C2]WMJ89627.1 endosialidase [Anaerocolumna sp. MB42-C2]